jgi:hypothetical protein
MALKHGANANGPDVQKAGREITTNVIADHIRDLVKFANSLPETKDGVTAYPGMKVYVQTDDSEPVVQEDQAILRVAYFDANEIRDAYATRAAAEAAFVQSREHLADDVAKPHPSAASA